MNRKRSREQYLELCADILCRAAYRMCRENYKNKGDEERTDPKILKETCTAVKEAAAVVSGLEKKVNTESIRIMFSDTQEYSE